MRTVEQAAPGCTPTGRRGVSGAQGPLAERTPVPARRPEGPYRHCRPLAALGRRSHHHDRPRPRRGSHRARADEDYPQTTGNPLVLTLELSFTRPATDARRVSAVQVWRQPRWPAPPAQPPRSIAMHWSPPRTPTLGRLASRRGRGTLLQPAAGAIEALHRRRPQRFDLAGADHPIGAPRSVARAAAAPRPAAAVPATSRSPASAADRAGTARRPRQARRSR